MKYLFFIAILYYYLNYCLPPDGPIEANDTKGAVAK